jgi:N-acetylmuramoyl-L-alanine amidase
MLKKNVVVSKLLEGLIIVVTFLVPFSLLSQQIKTVVIDAGHGGKDPGCHGNFAFEKEVCLSMALKNIGL